MEHAGEKNMRAKNEGYKMEGIHRCFHGSEITKKLTAAVLNMER